MKKFTIKFLSLILSLFIIPTTVSEEVSEMTSISITVGSKVFSAKFHNNESAKAITSQMPLTFTMRDFSSQEKVAPLLFDLPNASTQVPSSIKSGEIYLWSGNQMVLFYTSFSSNSYSYVPVGYIEDISELKDALGKGDVTITFSTKDLLTPISY